MEESPSAPLLPPAPVPPPGPPPDVSEKGFIASLLDLSFKSFVTPTLVRALYLFLVACVAVSTVFWIFDRGFMDMIWRLIASPLVLLVGVVLSRIAVELIMVAFRILELLRRMDARQRDDTPPKI
jgi:hypothetical protein